MNKIDDLMIRAKRVASKGLELCHAMISQNGDSWTAQAHLWDGTAGHAPSIQRTSWPTIEAAVEHIRAMSQEYPNSRDVPVIIDDLGG